METKYVLQLVDVQEIAKNAGFELTKGQAKELLNTCYTELCNTCEEILGENAKILFKKENENG